MKLKQWGQISDLRQDKHKFFIEFPFTEKRACFACKNPAIANLNSVPKYTDDGHQEVAREHENDGGWFQTNELKRYDGDEAECDLCINRKFTCFGTLFSKINHFDLFHKLDTFWKTQVDFQGSPLREVCWITPITFSTLQVWAVVSSGFTLRVSHSQWTEILMEKFKNGGSNGVAARCRAFTAHCQRRVRRRRGGYKQSQRDSASVKTGRADPLGASRGSKSYLTEQGGWHVRKLLHNLNKEHYSLPPISLYRPYERCSTTRSAIARGHGVEVNGSSTDRVRTKMSSIYWSCGGAWRTPMSFYELIVFVLWAEEWSCLIIGVQLTN